MSPGNSGNNSNSENKKRELPQPAYRKLQVRGEVAVGESLFPKALEELTGGAFAVYHLDDQTAVLAIRSFKPEEGRDRKEFAMAAHTLVKDAITYLTANHYKRLVIDVTGNGGGLVDLGIDTVRQLFPDKDHFFATNMRWSPALATILTDGRNANGTTFQDYRKFNNEQGQDIKSVQEFLGPVHRDGDYFTPIMRNDVMDSANNIGLPGNYSGHQPFTTENIVLVRLPQQKSYCALGTANTHSRSRQASAAARALSSRKLLWRWECTPWYSAAARDAPRCS